MLKKETEKKIYTMPVSEGRKLKDAFKLTADPRNTVMFIVLKWSLDTTSTNPRSKQTIHRRLNVTAMAIDICTWIE